MSNRNLFHSIKSVSVVDRIVEELTNAIIDGKLKPGDKLPTEMELMEQLGVSRNSVREALGKLESYGVIEIRSRGEGTFVRSGFSDVMLNPLLYGILLSQGPYEYLIELRRLIEVGVMQMAVEKATDEDIIKMKDIHKDYIKEINKTNPDINKVYELDHKFHDAIEQSVHNPLVTKVSSVISKLVMHSRLLTIEQIFKANKQKYLIDTHTKLLDLIINRDSASVPQVVVESYEYWKTVYNNDSE